MKKVKRIQNTSLIQKKKKHTHTHTHTHTNKNKTKQKTDLGKLLSADFSTQRELSITVDPKTIMNELRDYYQNLYSNQDYDLSEELCSDALDDNYIPSLSEM